MPRLLRLPIGVTVAFILAASTVGRARQSVTISGPPLPQNRARQTGTAAVSGVVIDGRTGEPAAGATATLNLIAAGSRLSRAVVTDAKGRFAFVNLPAADRYELTASKPGYFTAGYGSSDADSRTASPIVLREGDWKPDARVTIWPAGAIGGTVIDEAGEVVVGVYVRVLKAIRVAGRPLFAAGPVVETDDRGQYRLSGLSPGRYVVEVPSVQASVPASANADEIAGRSRQMAARMRASGQPLTDDPLLDPDGDARLIVGHYAPPPPPVGGVPRTYPPAFYPAATSVGNATTIELRPGDTREGIDVRLTPVPAASVSGVVQGPPDKVAHMSLRLVPTGLEDLGNGSEVAGALTDDHGRFTFLRVPQGSYTLEARCGLSEFQLARDFALSLTSPRLPSPPGHSGSARNSQEVDAAPPGTAFLTESFGATQDCYAVGVPVTVGGAGLTTVVATARQAGLMSGTITIESDTNMPPAPTHASSLTTDPADGRPSLGRPRPRLDRTAPADEFTIDGLLSGAYYLRPATPAWVIKSIQWNGHEYRDAAFDASARSDFAGVDVTMVPASAAARLTGTVEDGHGGPAGDAAVILFPAEEAQWTNYGLSPPRIRSVLVSSAATYDLMGVPAGKYLVIAVPGSQQLRWQEPGFFKQAAAQARRVTLAWEETTNQDLMVVEVR